MKAEMKAVVASLVVIALALTAVSGITYSWFSAEEKATIDVTTGIIDIESTNATIAVNDGTPVPFEFGGETAAVTLGTLLKPGDVISVKYETKNNSTIDAFMVIDCNLNVFNSKQTISTEVKSEGSAVTPVSGHYVLSKDATYSIEITIKILTDAGNEFADVTETLTITNKAIQSDAPIAVSTASDLTEALANDAIKSIKFTGDITSAITTSRDVELVVDGTITSPGATITVSSGTLTLSGDGVIESTGTRAEAKATVSVSPDATLIMNSGTIKSQNYIGLRIGDAHDEDASAAFAELNGGKIVALEEAILIANNSTLSITGGEYTSEDNAVIMGNGSDIKNVTVNITGGTFIGNIRSEGYAACGIFVSSPGNWNIDGATFKIKNGTAICVRTGNVVIGTHNTYEITVDDGFTGSKIGDSTYIIKTGSTSVITGYYTTGAYNHTDADTLKVGDMDISLDGTISYYDKDGNPVSLS